MQNRDGGWAAYDVDIDNQVLTKLPFADHNAMLDPSCADITARVIELLGTLGYRQEHPFGRTGARVSLPHARAGRVLVRALGRQLHLRHLAGLAGALHARFPDGSSGDRAGRPLARVDSAAFRSLGRDVPKLRRTGPEGHRRADPVADGVGDPGPDRRRSERRLPRSRRGIDYLIETQLADGSWEEDSFTGTGFSPRVLPAIPLLSGVLPADGDRPVPGSRSGRRARRTARPLSPGQLANGTRGDGPRSAIILTRRPWRSSPMRFPCR